MERLHAPELPTLGRAIDLEGWARVALGPSERSGAARSSADIARVLWTTVWEAAVDEHDRRASARAWFEDLALGRCVLPGHLLIRPDAARDRERVPATYAAHDQFGAEAALARHDELHAATVLYDDTGDRPPDVDERPESAQPSMRHRDNGASPHALFGVGAAGERISPTYGPVFSALPQRRLDPREAPLARRLEDLAERPRARLLFTRRARWVHPAVRPAAVTVVGPPLVRAWINVMAFADAILPNEGRTIDWSALRAAAERATRLLDGLLTAHDHDRDWRRIGLGLAGLSDAFESLGIDYGGDAARVLARRVANAVAEQAHRTSVQLAEERGVFELFGATRWAHLERQRRNALCTLSWPSDGLHAACGVSEGVAWHGVDDPDVPMPSLESQVRLEVECQRAFEGVVAVNLVAAPERGDDYDTRALAHSVLELDVQCLAIERLRHSELRPARPEASASVARPSAPESAAHGTGLPNWRGNSFEDAPRGALTFGVDRTSDDRVSESRAESRAPATTFEPSGHRVELSLSPAVRVEATTDRGRWTFDVVLDARSECEREIVLVAAPPGSDGWRLVDRLNSELRRDGGLAAALSNVAAELLDASAATQPSANGSHIGGEGARELARVLTQFVQERRAPARPRTTH